jgi:hypothetical protein
VPQTAKFIRNHCLTKQIEILPLKEAAQSVIEYLTTAKLQTIKKNIPENDKQKVLFI